MLEILAGAATGVALLVDVATKDDSCHPRGDGVAGDLMGVSGGRNRPASSFPNGQPWQPTLGRPEPPP
jgi:hypothetical protein